MAISAPEKKASLALIGRAIRRLLSQSVAASPDCLDRVTAERPVDLLAQVADVDIHDVRVALVREVPDVLDEPRPAKDLTGMPHEVVEKPELLRRELDGNIPVSDPLGRRVQGEIFYPEHCWPFVRSS